MNVLFSKLNCFVVAHCLYGKNYKLPDNPENLKIILGAHNLTDEHEPGRQICYAKEMKIHEEWQSFGMKFTGDISIIRLKSSVTFNEYVQPICLMTTDQDFIKASISSWGEINNDGDLSDIPKFIDLEIQNMTDCLVHEPELQHIFWNDSFCTKRKDAIGICIGDGGSGVYVQINNTFYLKGIVSSSVEGYCSKNVFALCSDIPKYFNFIKVKRLHFNL